MKKKNKMFAIIALVAFVLAIVNCFIKHDIAWIGIVLWELFFVASSVLVALNINLKENTILKSIFLGFVFLACQSWIIEAGAASGGEITSYGLMRVSIYELFNYPLLTFQYFIQPILFILVVGGFYGVLKETGKYRNILEKIAKSMKGKETLFLVITSFLLAALSSVFGLNIMLFIFMPALVAIVLLMGYDKITALLTVFMSTLIGVIGSTYGQYITGYINQVLSLTYQTEIIAKIALFVLSYVVFIAFTLKHASKNKAKIELSDEEDVKLLGEKKQSKKANWPFYVVMGLLLVVTILSFTDWNNIFEISVFSDFHNTLNTWTIGEHTVVAYLIKNLNAFGSWYYTELTVLVLLTSILFAVIYKVKSNKAFDGFINGVKQVVKPAIIVALAYVLTVLVAYHPFIVTLTDWMVGFTANISNVFGDILFIIMTSLNTVISSLTNIEMLYVIQSTLPVISGLFAESTSVLAIITQSVYGLTMFVAPTSTLLILGLEYLGIPYKTWIKSSWKLILELLAVIIVIISVVKFI